jgi:hypothetical protein
VQRRGNNVKQEETICSRRKPEVNKVNVIVQQATDIQEKEVVCVTCGNQCRRKPT